MQKNIEYYFNTLREKFLSMNLDDLAGFVGQYYYIDENNQLMPINDFLQSFVWNNTIEKFKFFDCMYFIKNGITPQEFILAAYDVRMNYVEYKQNQKIKKVN